MTVRITRTEGQDSERTVVCVEGTLTREGAELLDGVCGALSTELTGVTLNLAAVQFVDGDAASTLRELERRGARIESPNDFVSRMIELAE